MHGMAIGMQRDHARANLSKSQDRRLSVSADHHSASLEVEILTGFDQRVFLSFLFLFLSTNEEKEGEGR